MDVDRREREESGRGADRPHRANVFSPDEGATVGIDNETVVTDDYKPLNNRFTGTIRKIVVEVR